MAELANMYKQFYKHILGIQLRSVLNNPASVLCAVADICIIKGFFSSHGWPQTPPFTPEISDTKNNLHHLPDIVDQKQKLF